MRTESDGTHQMLQVRDDGPGISLELRGRIFEPFFTTKDVGQGTGLGLSISLGIATAHGGSLILCDSVKGACFELRLPVYQTATVIAPRAGGARSCRVLIVEDEAPIRGLLSRLLARRGHTVAEAACVSDAMALIDRGNVDLVLCDVTLGDESGVDCFRQTQALKPDLAQRFVFVTGDAGAMGLQPDLRNVQVLAKPFTAADLDRVLAEVVPHTPSLIANS